MGLCALRRRIRPTKGCLVEEANATVYQKPYRCLLGPCAQLPLIAASGEILQPFVLEMERFITFRQQAEIAPEDFAQTDA